MTNPIIKWEQGGKDDRSARYVILTFFTIKNPEVPVVPPKIIKTTKATYYLSKNYKAGVVRVEKIPKNRHLIPIPLFR